MDVPGELVSHAFISYVREDSGLVDRLQQVLQSAGIRVWRDNAELWPGEDWRAEIRRAITADALVFIACFSRSSVARQRTYQNEELVLAIEQMRLRRPDQPWLIPVRFDECEIPDLAIGAGRTLASIQRVDLFGHRLEEETERLVRAVQRILGQSFDAVTAANAHSTFQRGPADEALADDSLRSSDTNLSGRAASRNKVSAQVIWPSIVSPPAAKLSGRPSPPDASASAENGGGNWPQRSVSIDPHGLGRPQHPDARTAPLRWATPGDIVIYRPYPEPGIYILYQDNSIALLAPTGTMPDVSPRGDWISYVVNEREIWLVRPQGSERRQLAKITDLGFKVSAAPRWSPDARYLAFELRQDKGRNGFGTSNIYLLEVSTGECKSVTGEVWVQDEAHGPVTWTPKGHMIFISGNQKKLCLLKGGQCTTIYEPELIVNNIAPRGGRNSVCDPVYAPNGMVVFIESGSDISAFVACLSLRQFSLGRSGKGRFIGEIHFGSNIRSPRIMADNDTIVYAAANRIYRFNWNRQLISATRKIGLRLRPSTHEATLVCENASDPVPIIHEWKAELGLLAGHRTLSCVQGTTFGI